MPNRKTTKAKRSYRIYDWHRLRRRGDSIKIPLATRSTRTALSQHKRNHGGEYATRMTKGGTLIVERVG